MYKLVIEDEDGRATEIPLIRDEVTIGRREGNTVRLPERNISRRHARLFKSDGNVWLEDGGSRYGIKVNGARLRERLQLDVGDHIQIGDYQIALQLEGDVVDSVAPQHVPREGEEDEEIDTAVVRMDDIQPDIEPPPPPAPSAEEDSSRPGQLIVLSANVPKETWTLDQPETTIGREGPLDVVVDHPSMSRTHARIHFNGKRYSIVDLDSANGIKVNGDDIGAQDLHSGDVIQLGDVKLRFVRKGEQGPLERAVVDYHRRRESVHARRLVIGLVAALAVIVAIFLIVALSSGSSPKPAPASPVAAAPTRPQAPARAVAPTDEPSDELLGDARRLLEEQKWRAAAALLGRVLQSDSKNEEAQELLSRAQDEALYQQTFEELRKAAGRRDFETFDLKLAALPPGSIYFGHAEALAEELRPERAAFFISRGDRAREEGLLREARVEYEAALKGDPENLEAQRGVTMVSLRLRAEARRRGAARPAADDPDPAPTGGAAEQGEAPEPAPATAPPEPAPAEPAPQPEPQIEAKPKAVAAKPVAPPKPKADSKATRTRQGMLLYHRARKLIQSDPPTAEAMLLRAIRLHPKAAGAHRLLGNYYAEQGKPKKACKHLKKFLKLSPKHPQGQAIREQLDRFGCPL